MGPTTVPLTVLHFLVRLLFGSTLEIIPPAIVLFRMGLAEPIEFIQVIWRFRCLKIPGVVALLTVAHAFNRSVLTTFVALPPREAPTSTVWRHYSFSTSKDGSGHEADTLVQISARLPNLSELQSSARQQSAHIFLTLRYSHLDRTIRGMNAFHQNIPAKSYLPSLYQIGLSR